MAAITHRKLLLQQHSDLNSTCSDCGPTCPYNCTYQEFYWPPQPPPIPQHTTTTTNNRISPYAIVIVTLLGSAFLFFSYYVFMHLCSTRFRRRPETQISDHAQDFHQERGFEVDHPIWYINTIGLQSSVINSISVFKYKKDDNLIDGTDCSVCLCEFQDNETLRLLPKCNHAFHVPCIDTWLRSHTNCPICRAGILSNTLTAVVGLDDHNFTSETGSNRNTQMENLDDRGGSSGNGVTEIEICDENEDLKTEYESGSISMDDCVARELEMISGDSM